MKPPIQSIFLEHYDRLNSISSPTSMKEEILQIVQQSRINDMDKRKIKLDVGPLESLYQLQRYLTNSILKYQGLGVRKQRF